MICFSKCMPIGQFIFAVTFLGSLIFIFLSIVLLHLTLVRRALKTLPKDKAYNSFYDMYFGLWRPIMFGYASVIPFYNNLPQFREAYNDMDIAAFANRFEKAVAYLMIVSTLIVIFGTLFVFISEWLNIYTW